MQLTIAGVETTLGTWLAAGRQFLNTGASMFLSFVSFADKAIPALEEFTAPLSPVIAGGEQIALTVLDEVAAFLKANTTRQADGSAVVNITAGTVGQVETLISTVTTTVAKVAAPAAPAVPTAS